jgi:hypothetical protein
MGHLCSPRIYVSRLSKDGVNPSMMNLCSRLKYESLYSTSSILHWRRFVQSKQTTIYEMSLHGVSRLNQQNQGFHFDFIKFSYLFTLFGMKFVNAQRHIVNLFSYLELHLTIRNSYALYKRLIDLFCKKSCVFNANTKIISGSSNWPGKNPSILTKMLTSNRSQTRELSSHLLTFCLPSIFVKARTFDL